MMAEPEVESTVAAAPGGEGEEHEAGIGAGREEEDGSASEGGVQRKRKWWRALSGMVFPTLTLHKGRESLGARKSSLVIATLYASHSFSAWGDRMWDFVVFLLLALLYPGSLLLPGVYGFTVGLGVAVLGTLVGDWVDTHSRMKVVGLSLLVQNKLLALCAVLLALMFQLEWNVCLNLAVFAGLSVLVILLGSGSRLATVANTIAIEKDWVVVLADGNADTLALLNANMRRIDLLCKLLAPAITGVFLQHTGPFVTTLIVAGWNIVSFFGELGLVWVVYRMVPTLAIKKYRKPRNVELLAFSNPDLEGEDEGKGGGNDGESGLEEEEDGGGWRDDIDSQDSTEEDGLIDGVLDLRAGQRRKKCSSSCSPLAKKLGRQLLNPLVTIKDGWRIYIRQDIARVGFALAALYLTVLGFSGVTSAYFLTQGLRNDLIGLCQGIGAIFGVAGTLIYPVIRKKIGTVRAGLFGISSQLAVLLFCALAVVVPSNRVSSEATSYYSPDCSEYVSLNASGGLLDNATVLPTLSICVTIALPLSGSSASLTPQPIPISTQGEATTRSIPLISILPTHTSIQRQSGTGIEASLPSAHTFAPVPTSAAPVPTSAAPVPTSANKIAPSTALTALAQTSNLVNTHTLTFEETYTAVTPNRTRSPTQSTTQMSTALHSEQAHRTTTAATDSATSLQLLPQPTTTGGRSQFPNRTTTSGKVKVTSPTTTSLPREKRANVNSDNSPEKQIYCSPLPPVPSPTPHPSSDGGEVSVALVLMLIGVIGARTGLWMFDLSVSQLIQEKVIEEERGVVSGVINAMTSLMDMLHYVLVIAAPRPEQFNILTFISVAMVTIGALLYASYVHKVRGHLFHFSECYNWLKRKCGRGRSGRGFLEVSQQEETAEATCLVNTAGVELAEEDGGMEDDR